VLQLAPATNPIGIAVITPSMWLKTGDLGIIVVALAAYKRKAILPHTVI